VLPPKKNRHGLSVWSAIVGQDSKIEIDALSGLRIIAEDDVHVVIAVRIEKAWLAKNIRFLATLADLATAKPHHGARLALSWRRNPTFFRRLAALDLPLDSLAYHLAPLDLTLDGDPDEVGALFLFVQHRIHPRKRSLGEPGRHALVVDSLASHRTDV
jgi:hypothetical protein